MHRAQLSHREPLRVLCDQHLQQQQQQQRFRLEWYRLAEELRGSGVRAVTIDPGEMDTQMHADALPDADPTSLADPQDVARWMIAALREPAESSRWTAQLGEVHS